MISVINNPYMFSMQTLAASFVLTLASSGGEGVLAPRGQDAQLAGPEVPPAAHLSLSHLADQLTGLQGDSSVLARVRSVSVPIGSLADGDAVHACLRAWALGISDGRRPRYREAQDMFSSLLVAPDIFTSLAMSMRVVKAGGDRLQVLYHDHGMRSTQLFKGADCLTYSSGLGRLLWRERANVRRSAGLIEDRLLGPLSSRPPFVTWLRQEGWRSLGPADAEMAIFERTVEGDTGGRFLLCFEEDSVFPSAALDWITRGVGTEEPPFVLAFYRPVPKLFSWGPAGAQTARPHGFLEAVVFDLFAETGRVVASHVVIHDSRFVSVGDMADELRIPIKLTESTRLHDARGGGAVSTWLFGTEGWTTEVHSFLRTY